MANNSDQQHPVIRQASPNEAGPSTSSAAGSSGVGVESDGSVQAIKIGHYELIKTLGRGNFSTVKLARHKITNHSVAVKIVKLGNLSENNLMKVDREIEIMMKLGRHENIVRLYQVIRTAKYYFLVTDCCTKGELYAYIISKGKLSEQRSCKYFMQIVSAVGYLHDNNIVHRDLKAENLLLTDEYKTIKLADFGFANYYAPDDLLSTWCGSPPYAAPELFEGVSYIGPQVDIWSLGVVLYVLVTGSLPFDGKTLVFLKNRVLNCKFRIPFFMTTECESIIKGMLRRDPEKRFSIRQIKTHSWIRKFGSMPDDMMISNTSPVDNNNDTQNVMQPSLSNNHAPAYDSDKIRSTDRGQSLDLDETSKVTIQNQPDSSVIASTSNCININLNDCNHRTESVQMNSNNVRHFVDSEIVNAVSNMSIDSNNSSTSNGLDAANSTTPSHYSSYVPSLAGSLHNSGHQHGQPSPSTSQQTQQQPQQQKSDGSRLSNSRQHSQESSVDEQIIDFMVENLKVAREPDEVRQKIADEKYGDLHAIYSLLKDQPAMFLEAKSSELPSLPLISPSRDDGHKRPSITTGFFNVNEIGNDTNETNRDNAETYGSTNDSSVDLIKKKNSEGAAVSPVMNNLASQNTAGMQNHGLLDVAGTSTGFERRASDGQASYSGSYTNATGNERVAANQCDTMRNELGTSQLGQARKRMRSEEVAGWRSGEDTFRQEDKE